MSVPGQDIIPVPVSKCDQTNAYEIIYEASHCMIYAEDKSKFQITDKNNILKESYDHKFAIMMQIRFDGYIGFPGGIIDPGEDSVAALQRELKEELHLDNDKFAITEDNYIVSYYYPSAKLRAHFYALKVSIDDFINIERSSCNSSDYGCEVLGYCRVPLYTMRDGYRGFPAFLNNNFVSCAKTQLLYTIEHLKIMPKEEIGVALNALPNVSAEW